MSLLRAVEIAQPDYQWQYQLRHERDITAQVKILIYNLFRIYNFINDETNQLDGGCQSSGRIPDSCNTSGAHGSDRERAVFLSSTMRRCLLPYKSNDNYKFNKIIYLYANFDFQVANAMVSSWAGPPAMLMIFRKLFGSFSCQQIVRQNNFANFQHYFLQKV